MAGLSSEVIKHALALARENGYAEIEIGTEDAAFSARLEPAARPKLSASATPGATAPEPEDKPIKSPIVGYFAHAAEPFTAGKQIKKGQVFGQVNALGIANDVESPVAGEVLEVLVAEGDAVEYGQVLARVKK